MRGSLKDLINTVTAVPGGGGASIENFMTGLANSGWLKHVKAVLDVSIAIADCILSNRSVIVHCSDGWDRTSQTCALTSLMLDGYYRTIQGFHTGHERDDIHRSPKLRKVHPSQLRPRNRATSLQYRERNNKADKLLRLRSGEIKMPLV